MIGDLLLQARHARGESQKSLGVLAGVSHVTISNIERGQVYPSESLTASLAAALDLPRSFFSLEERPLLRLEAPLFRKKKKAKAKLINKNEARSLIYYRSYRGILKEAGVSLPNEIPDFGTGDPEELAEGTRRYFNLPEGSPIPNTMNLVEKNGAHVIALFGEDCQDSDELAFSTWSSDKKPVIVTTSKNTFSSDRLRFSIAHELGHLVMHRKAFYASQNESAEIDSENFDVDKLIDLLADSSKTTDWSDIGLSVEAADEEADHFAGAFLMPKEAILEDFSKVKLTPAGLINLKAKWRVSLQALFMRAKRLGLVEENKARYFFMDMSRRKWRRQEPIRIPHERTQVLRRSIIHLCRGQEFKHVATKIARLKPVELLKLAEMEEVPRPNIYK